MLFTQGIVLATLSALLSAAPLDTAGSPIFFPITNQSVATTTDPEPGSPFRSSYVTDVWTENPIVLYKRVVQHTVIPLNSRNGKIYAATVDIGDTTFRVAIDTGCTRLILPGPDCKSATDDNRPTISPALLIGADKDKLADNAFGLGDRPTSGFIHPITVTLGEQTVIDASVMVALTVDEGLLYSPSFDVDGVLGLVPSTTQASSLVQSLAERTAGQPIFSLLLRRDVRCQSKLILGTPDDNLYEGQIAYGPTLHQSMWSINMNVFVKGRQLPGPIRIDIMTGFQGITGDTASVEKFYEELSSDAHRTDRTLGNNRLWEFPCSSADDIPITLTFGDGSVHIPLARESLVLEEDTDTSSCTGRIYELPRGFHNMWIVGAPFLHDLYVIFDAQPSEGRVGFAKISDAVKNEPCTPS